jgi:sugar lactone lactonase YvrE
MVLKGDTLFAADVGGVRMFDRATGRPLGTLRIAARGLNDLAIGPDGAVYVTDLEPPPNGPPTNAPMAAIYRATPQGGTPVVQGNNLEQPDGLLADDSGFVVAPFGASELYRIDSIGAKKIIAALPGGKLDGLYPLPGGGWAVTSWDKQAVYRVDPSGAVTLIAENIESPAQLGLDAKRHVMMIPSFNRNSLEIRPLKQ